MSTLAYARQQAGELSEGAYIRAIAFFTLLVAGIVAAGSVVSSHWKMSWPLLIITFIASLVCIFIFKKSDSPVVSFLGVGGMSAALGFMIGPVVSSYHRPVIIQAIVITAIIMGVMSVIGIV